MGVGAVCHACIMRGATEVLADLAQAKRARSRSRPGSCRAVSGASQWVSILRVLLVYECGSWPKKGVSMRKS